LTRDGMHGTLPSGEPGADLDPRVQLEEGRIALLAGDFERASRVADRVLLAHPSALEAWILKGRSLVCRYDLQAALDCYERAILLDPGSSEAWRRKGFAHRLAGEPGDHRTLMHMGSALDELGEFTDAIECYERVLAHDPDHSYAKESLRLNQRILRRLEEGQASRLGE
jgi:tetratricopeptide (TPR) repeat protein